MLLLRLATRNLVRNKRRTIISMLAIALTYGLAMVSANLEYGVWEDRIQASISAMSGHVVVQADGYNADPEIDAVVERSSEAAAVLRATFPNADVLRRTMVAGLVTSPNNSARMLVMGVEPEREEKYTVVDNAIAEAQGAWLTPDDTDAIVIGVTIADTLQVDVGDRIVLMTQADGEMVRKLFRIKGIFRTGTDMVDGFVAYAPIAHVQSMLPGEDPAHNLSILLPSAHDTTAMRDDAIAALARPELEVLTWRQSMPALKQMMDLDRGFSKVIWAFLACIIGVVILTTLLMSVLERIREFGVLLALGMRPRQIAWMVILESAMLAITGVGVGLLLQAMGTWPLITYGIDYGDIMANGSDMAGVVLDPVVRARWDFTNMFWYGLVAVSLTMLSTIWPAYKAMRLRPVDAMRHS